MCVMVSTSVWENADGLPSVSKTGIEILLPFVSFVERVTDLSHVFAKGIFFAVTTSRQVLCIETQRRAQVFKFAAIAKSVNRKLRFGLTAKPTEDRWHEQPTALFGGVAIVVPTLLLALKIHPLGDIWHLVVCGGALACFGLLDDVFSELDPDRAEALVAHLPAGQAMLTTAGGVPAGAHPELVVHVSDGRISA